LALGLCLDEELHGDDRLEPLSEQLGQRRGGGRDGKAKTRRLRRKKLMV
jgi:hypothetical protein